MSMAKFPFLKFTEVFYWVILVNLPLAKQVKREEDRKTGICINADKVSENFANMTDFPDRNISWNYYERNRSYSRDRAYYKNDYRSDYRNDYSKKIVGISNTRDIRENIKVIIKTHMTRITIELATETRIGAKIDIKAKTNTEMTELEVGLKKKITYMMMMMIYLTQK